MHSCKFDMDCLCIAVLCILYNDFVMIEAISEGSKESVFSDCLPEANSFFTMTG